MDFDAGTGTTQLTSTTGSLDAFILKMDASGKFIWAKSFGGSSDESSKSICFDASGNLYTTGYFKETVDFDPDAGTTYLTSAGRQDVFIQKMDSSGNFLWARSFGNAKDEFASCIAIDDSGNIYTTGNFYGTLDFDPGAGISNLTSVEFDDIFIQKMDSSGNFIWAKSFGGGGGFDAGFSIAVDAFNNVYTTGRFDGTVDFDPGVGTANLNSVATDIFVQKMDASGNLIWAKSLGGFNTVDLSYSIKVDPMGYVYTAGQIYGPADFDPGVDTTILRPVGGIDIFVQKMSQCMLTAVDTQSACNSYKWRDGKTYTSSTNTPKFIIPNASGCDSVITLNLTINSDSVTDVISACDSITWIDGKTYTSSNNTASFTLTNAAGCDSVITLNLTINADSVTDVITACNSYKWIDGNTYTSSNDTARYTLTNSAGCDSVVTLKLTIKNSNTGTDTITACNSYKWIDGKTYTSSNDTAKYTLTNAAGCDSVVTLNLTIKKSSTGTDTITACDSY